MKKTVIIAVLLCALTGAGFLYFSQKNSNTSEIIVVANTITHHVDGQRNYEAIKIQTTSSNRETFENIINNNALNSHIIDRFKETPKQYQISYRLEQKNDIADIMIYVDQDKRDASLSFSGFTPKEKITIKTNDKYIYKDIGADWAGQLIISNFSLKDQSLCIDIKESNSSLCHSLSYKEATL